MALGMPLRPSPPPPANTT
uniref:Uncharacterized protein n=1 Tax=Rhizophora mucronata TaxID=61149 RepID=A0A2P2N3Y7_RHIMU